LSGCNRVGKGTRTLGRPLVHNEGRIEIGSNTTIRSLGTPVRLTATVGGTISIGDDAIIDVGANLFSDGSVLIANEVVLGPNVTVCDRDENGRVGEIVIETRARIGAGARVIGPCHIGPDAIVLAGTVVRGHVAEGAVVGPEYAESRVNGASPRVRASHPDTVNGVEAQAPIAATPAVRRAVAVLAADFTVDELADHLNVPDYDGLAIEAEVAPFDQIVSTLVALEGREPKVDLALVWTRPDRTCPSFQELLLGGEPDPEQVFAEVDAFVSILKQHASAARFVFVPSWVVYPSYRGLGVLEFKGSRATRMLLRMNLRLADALSDASNIFVLDAQRWMAAASDGGFDPKLWHAAKVAFTTGVMSEAARDILAALRGVLGMSRKLIVVDLDDTVWGGIVGDVGWESLRLGGHDPIGEAFVQFQRQLLALTKRGIALAVVSKNEESTAIEAMQRHPEMVIKPEMLAAVRINWHDKAENVVDIARELNLGLQSVVFLDDNPVERARVREALPEVYVPEWPVDPTHYPRALDSLTCFDTPHVSAEDRERNAMYANERERNTLRSGVSSVDDWLATLELRVRFERLSSSNLARATQLLNKTNQMNLRTRRLSETEFLAWSQEDGHEVWTAHVSDRLGNAGLTGIVGLARNGDDVLLVDYVLSCRVMGRRVEETLLWAATQRGVELGGLRLLVTPLATAKNKPCLDFVARAGLPRVGDGYVQPLDSAGPGPSLVTVEGLP
jgi:FkbH-like protein